MYMYFNEWTSQLVQFRTFSAILLDLVKYAKQQNLVAVNFYSMKHMVNLLGGGQNKIGMKSLY